MFIMTNDSVYPRALCALCCDIDQLTHKEINANFENPR